MQEYLAMWQNYANYKGRTSVRGYWMAVLFNVLAAIILAVLMRVSGIFGVVYSLYAIAVLIPGICLGIRRLHDTNRSGFFILLSFIPIIGGIVVLVLFCMKSVDVDNRYGADQV